MKILITGGHGTVGSFLAKQLSYDILNPSKEELDLFNAQQVSDYLDQHKVDIVIHCALTGRNDLFSIDPRFTTDSLWMFRNLWNNKHKFKKLINLGTAYEYDLKKNNWLVTEHSILDHLPSTSYGYAKNIIARTIRETHNFFNLRLFGVFHENESDQRFFKKLLINESIDINNDVYFDYIYLEDIVPMINTIIDDVQLHRDINMVYHTKYKMSELATLFCQVHGIDPEGIKIIGCNGLNLTGDSHQLDQYKFDYVGLEAGFRSYKI
jgi:GDP-L-fucose synthase